jgi:hypothetical protein
VFASSDLRGIDFAERPGQLSNQTSCAKFAAGPSPCTRGLGSMRQHLPDSTARQRRGPQCDSTSAPEKCHVSPDHLYAGSKAAEGPQLEAQLQGLWQRGGA